MTFNPGDKVAARYGALLDDGGEPMTATVLGEGPGDYVLIRYRCTDGSATDNWVRDGHLDLVEPMQAESLAAADLDERG